MSDLVRMEDAGRRWSICLCCGVLMCLALGTLGDQAQRVVLFSFGKVEALRDGASEWEFVRPDMALADADLLRMPPVSLLRLSDGDSRQLGLLTGVHESQVGRVIEEARTATDAALPVGTGEDALGGYLPAGDAASPGSARERFVRFDGDRLARWRRNELALDAGILAVARTALARSEEEPVGLLMYANARLREVSRLYRAVTEAADEPSGPQDALVLLTALVGAAGIPHRRVVSPDGVPFLLIAASLSPKTLRRVTANRELLPVDAGGTVYIPLHPTSPATPYIEAWYRGAAGVAAAWPEGLGTLP